MMVVLVQFQLPAKMTREQVELMFAQAAPKFQEIPGLIRKYFLLSDDGKTAGGVYFWKSQQMAEAFYTQEFRRSINDKFGSEPAITYFDSPVIVDNSLA